jgi:hypothetical protein
MKKIDHLAGLAQFYQNPYKNYPHWYKGAVHVHSNLSDGSQPPAEVLRDHRSKGYHFVFLTDHNRLSPPDLAPVDGLLYFRHKRSFECGQKYSHHILVLGIEPGFVKNYHDQVNAEVDPDQNGTCAWHTGDCANVYRRVQYYEYIAMAVLAHPHGEHHGSAHLIPGFGWKESELLDSRYRYTGIEIFNSSEAGPKAWYEGRFEDTGRMKQPLCLDWWDEVLKQGKAVWGFGSDDCHNTAGNGKSFNRSWIVVNSDRAFQDSLDMENDIIQNIEAGNFYTVVRDPDNRGGLSSLGPFDNGPSLEVKCVANTIRVITDRPSRFQFLVCQDSGQMRPVGPVGPLSLSSSFRGFDTDKYVRIVVDQTRDGEPYRVFSQPLFVIKAKPA